MKIEIRNGTRYVIDPAEGPLEVKYGLPPEVRFCTRCVVSNQRAVPSVVVEDRPDAPKQTIPFDDAGMCDACLVVSRKDHIDWGQREEQLRALLDRHRSRDGSYDCLVPGSGGKDSVYASHVLKTKYNMHPLTVTWAPHMYTDVGWRNFQNWVHVGGFDNHLFTADGRVQRTLTKLAYSNLLHPFQPFTLGQRYFPVKLALRMGIKLVFYGENAAEYGTVSGEDAVSLVPARYYTGERSSDLLIGGVPIGKLQDYGIQQGQLEPYLPVSAEQVCAAGIQVHYLGHFLRWTPQECYYYAAEHTRFEANSERTEGTYSKYNSIDDRVDGFHYWTAYIKFGIGRCTHEAAQEIRHGHITREEGVALVHKFDGELPRKYLPDFLDYLGMNESEFLAIADGFRSPHLWRKTGKGWELRHRVR
jgi:N-acetyl sugar amidotransferase